jgi:ComF family protein
MCVFCDTQKTLLCEECKSLKLEYYKTHFCHVCHADSQVELVHFECLEKTRLDGVIVVAHYNKYAKILIEEMKYNLYFALSAEIGFLMKRKLLEYNIHYEVAIPVPLHKFKENYRGFNQAELLSKAVTTNVDNCIRRTKNTKSQVSLNREKRLENLKDVFELKHQINYKSVLLVDDVMTSGSTLEECAKVLKKAGVEKVYGLVFARGD